MAHDIADYSRFGLVRRCERSFRNACPTEPSILGANSCGLYRWRCSVYPHMEAAHHCRCRRISVCRNSARLGDQSEAQSTTETGMSVTLSLLCYLDGCKSKKKALASPRKTPKYAMSKKLDTGSWCVGSLVSASASPRPRRLCRTSAGRHWTRFGSAKRRHTEAMTPT